MFRISTLKSQLSFTNPEQSSLDSDQVSLLSQFCIVDRWSADLNDAMLTLGPDVRRIHGLDVNREQFGLLEFVRTYDRTIHHEIVGLFEQAAADARPFHYSAELASVGQGKRVVHCFGDYRKNSAENAREELFGMFLFSREYFENN